MEISKYIIFSLILIYVPLWLQISLFISSLGKGKKSMTIIKDEKISKIIWEKCKTKIDTVKISESDLLFGMMIGIPGRPQLILSRKLYESFNLDELEYVILHEAGHYKLWHSIKELIEGIIFFVLGLLLLSNFEGPLGVVIGIISGLFFGVLMIQIAKLKEIQADAYSLKRLSNPQGMIPATNKFLKAWEDKSSKNKLIRFLFYRGNPYENRIRMAKEIRI